MSLKFLNGEISEEEYRKILPELLKKVSGKNQEKRILTIIEDVGVDSLEKYLGYNNVCKHHYTFKDDCILDEIEIAVIRLEPYTDRPRGTSYTGTQPDVKIPYTDFVNKLKPEALKKLAENLAKLGF